MLLELPLLSLDALPSVSVSVLAPELELPDAPLPELELPDASLPELEPVSDPPPRPEPESAAEVSFVPLSSEYGSYAHQPPHASSSSSTQ